MSKKLVIKTPITNATEDYLLNLPNKDSGEFTIATTSEVNAEATARQNADTNLQNQIDAIESKADVVDVVATKADLNNYDTSTLTDQDVIKVLADESQGDATTYYRWIITSGVGAWSLIGSVGPYVTLHGAQTIDGAKTFTHSSGITINSNNDSYGITLKESNTNTLRINGTTTGSKKLEIGDATNALPSGYLSFETVYGRIEHKVNSIPGNLGTHESYLALPLDKGTSSNYATIATVDDIPANISDGADGTAIVSASPDFKRVLYTSAESIFEGYFGLYATDSITAAEFDALMTAVTAGDKNVCQIDGAHTSSPGIFAWKKSTISLSGTGVPSITVDSIICSNAQYAPVSMTKVDGQVCLYCMYSKPSLDSTSKITVYKFKTDAAIVNVLFGSYSDNTVATVRQVLDAAALAPDVSQFVKFTGSTIYAPATIPIAKGQTGKELSYTTLAINSMPEGTNGYKIYNTAASTNATLSISPVPYVGAEFRGAAQPYQSGSQYYTLSVVPTCTSSTGTITYNLGESAEPWTNLYLSNNLSDGTNSITIAQIAAKADDSTVVHKGTVDSPSNETIYGSKTFGDYSHPAAQVIYHGGGGSTQFNSNGNLTVSAGYGTVVAKDFSAYPASAGYHDHTTYADNKITFTKFTTDPTTTAPILTDYNLSFPTKSGTLAIDSELLHKGTSNNPIEEHRYGKLWLDGELWVGNGNNGTSITLYNGGGTHTLAGTGNTYRTLRYTNSLGLTIDFPEASGTLALTDDLPKYIFVDPSQNIASGQTGPIQYYSYYTETGEQLSTYEDFYDYVSGYTSANSQLAVTSDSASLTNPGNTKRYIIAYKDYATSESSFVVYKVDNKASEVLKLGDIFVPIITNFGSNGAPMRRLEERSYGLELRAYSPLRKLVISGAWTNIKGLRDRSQLEPGTYYRITDYKCTTSAVNTKAAEHQFDILVYALDSNKLSENAYAIHHSGDTYFADSNLAAWKLKYCIDNDTNRFEWALDDSGAQNKGRGVIYWMQDEFGNEAPYDFKNILYLDPATKFVADDITFNRNTAGDTTISGIQYYGWSGSQGQIAKTRTVYLTTSSKVYDSSGIEMSVTITSVTGNKFTANGAYTFNYTSAGTTGDLSLKSGLSTGCTSNIIKPYIVLDQQKLNWNIFNSTDSAYASNCQFNSLGRNCYNNIFGKSCSSNILKESCYNNTFGDSCTGNNLEVGCHDNTFGNSNGINTLLASCQYITFGNSCSGNNIGKGGYSIHFGNGCSNNIIGNNNVSNTFGDSCTNNITESVCQYNIFGNQCYANYLRAYCFSNNFGTDCNYNIINTGSSYIKLGNYCSYNTFGSNCTQISLLDNNSTKTDYARNNIFENGVQFVDVTTSDTSASSSNQLQNIKVCQGVLGTSSTKKTITCERGAAYAITYMAAASVIRDI